MTLYTLSRAPWLSPVPLLPPPPPPPPPLQAIDLAAHAAPPFVRQLVQHVFSALIVLQFMFGLLDTSQVPSPVSLLLHRKALGGSLRLPPSWPLASRTARPVSRDTCGGSDANALS